MDENLIFGLKVTLMGNIVVFTALTLIWQIMELFRRLENPKSKKEEALPTHEIVHETFARTEISPEVVAAISAAVACIIDKKFQIKRIRYRNMPPEAAWSKQGIASIMGSHMTKRGYRGR